MSTQTIDYAALAEQARQQSAPKVDYAALAEQARQPAATPEKDKPPDSVGGGFLRRGWDALKSGVTSGLPHVSTDEIKDVAANPTLGNKTKLFLHATPGIAPISRMIEGQVGAEKEAAHQTADQWKRGEHTRAGVTALSMADPFATGSVTNVNRLEDEGRNKEAIGQGGFDALALAAGTKRGQTAIGKTAEATAPIVRSSGEGLVKVAPHVGKAAERAAQLGGVAEFIHSGNPVSLAGPVLSPLAGKVASGITRTGGRGLINLSEGMAARKVPDVPAEPEPAPAPYRASGGKLTEPITVMPRRIQTDPARMLGESTASGPVESEPETTITPLRATSPKAAQTEILRKAGVASPAATIKPMTRVPNADITPRADLKFSGSHSGEEAAMNQLTENVTPDRLGINELRGIAQQRGIKVSPGDNHVALYRKIQDSLTPEEIEQFDQARIERMQPDYSLPPISRAAEQGGHAGNGVSSVEELGRPGTNYVVSKSGQLTYHGKSFAPEGIPAGSTHVTALPDGTLRVNAGPKLTEAQEMTLRKAIPETEPRVPVSDADRENLLMRSIQRAKSAKAGD